MTIKKPIASYGTAHDELKDGDLISGKEIQLSTDINNALNTDNEGGLLVKPQAVILGMGMIVDKPFVRTSDNMNPSHTVYIPAYKYFTEDEFDYYAKNYDISIKGTSYIACEDDQDTTYLTDVSHRLQSTRESFAYANYYLNTNDDSHLQLGRFYIREYSKNFSTNPNGIGDGVLGRFYLKDPKITVKLISKQNVTLLNNMTCNVDSKRLSFIGSVMLWGGRKAANWNAYHIFDYQILAVKKEK